RSNIVGKPTGLLLLRENCTVTYCHSRTIDLSRYTKEADIIIAAVGSPDLITVDMIKYGSILIDVGMNRVAADNEKGYLLKGDIDFNGCKDKAAFITPVPGGVGPMTIAMLLRNTLQLAKKAHGIY
ncbi:MAG: bifunctional methylenetetrahydrofolate dehydrogenase/methenyltetrahydrofolate cyclohydrolase, partial [Actinomycetia bacterium]|nr:bifunctional methylenetetrahydrofolate dehydrogenase/methenyltetrahydrofolate cyclohydrolase [Actinomycetes bacterium]